MKAKKVTIIGLGLIGGSLARALRSRLGISDILALNTEAGSLEQAEREGVITKGFTALDDEVFSSDIIFICTPVKAALHYLDLLEGKLDSRCIVTDVGSTKSELVNHINESAINYRFVGGHPMAGSEKSGYSASLEHLFENAYYILCPSRTSDEAAIDEISALVSGIGALPLVLEAGQHDIFAGVISHLPHVLAAALVNMVSEKDTGGNLRMLAAGGFRDITRIASSDPQMWENIVLSNRQPVLSLMTDYIKRLEFFMEWVRKSNPEEIRHFFESARDYRSTLPAGRKGAIAPLYDIVVDVVDKPGIIGDIATLLGSNGVNIKNINVSNSREFEEGCLIISLPDMQSSRTACRLLLEKGYRVIQKNV